MKMLTITLLMILLMQLPTGAADIELVFRHGKPIQDRKVAWEGHVNFASWIDDELVAFSSRNEVACISTKTGKIHWKVKDVGEISDWSISRATKRLAILGGRKNNGDRL